MLSTIVSEAVACNCASLGLAFNAIGLFLMLLWASAEAVPASVNNPLLSEHPSQSDILTLLKSRSSSKSSHNEADCLSSFNNKQCKYFEDKIVLKRMKHRNTVRYSKDNSNNIDEPSTVNGSKDLHDRQVRSFEHNNRTTKNKFPQDKNTFASYENTKTSYEVVRNISLSDKLMNNGESVSMENTSEPALVATFKESDVKTNAQKETSDKIYLHVNGEFINVAPFRSPFLRFSSLFPSLLHKKSRMQEKKREKKLSDVWPE